MSQNARPDRPNNPTGAETAAQFARLRTLLLALINRIADHEADLTALPTKPAGYPAELAMLFAHRAALQDQFAAIRRVERVVASAKPATFTAELDTAVRGMQAALMEASRDGKVPDAAEAAVAAIIRLAAPCRPSATRRRPAS